MHCITHFALGFGLACSARAADAHADFYSAKKIEALAHALAQKSDRFAAQELARYSNHYTMLALRKAAGSAELHQHEADIFIVQNGNAVLITGGKIVDPHAEKPGEIRGTSIDGGERHSLSPGDIVHIPAGLPHQLLLDNKTQPFVYFVVKVTGQ